MFAHVDESAGPERVGVDEWCDYDDGFSVEPFVRVGPVVDPQAAPGALLAEQCQSAAVVPMLLDDGEVLDVVEGIDRVSRWAAGLRIRMLAEIARARRFVHVLPDTLACLEAGRIDERRADAIASATALLPDEKAREVEARILTDAPDATLKQLRDRIRRAVARVDPEGAYRRHREAVRERSVSIRSLEDGMASLWFYGPAEEIEAAWTMADRLARVPRDPGDERTLDQRRFDLAVQVLQGKLTVTDMADVQRAVDAALEAVASAGIETADADAGAGAGSPQPESESESESESADDADAPDRAAATDRPSTAAATDGASSATGVGRSCDVTSARDATSDDDATAADNEQAAPADCSTRPDAAGSAGDAGSTDCTNSTGSANSAGSASPSGAPPGARIDRALLTEIVAQLLAARPPLHDTIHKPQIQVVVALDTLLGSDRPAELVGHGPIDAVTARALAAGGVWARLVTDRLSGRLLDYGRTVYSPPADLADFVRARDQICRGPGCTRTLAELDHHIPFGGGHEGTTSEANLDGYCKQCHLLKDAPGWNVLAGGEDRTLTWVSPHGRRTVTAPYDYRAFTDPLTDAQLSVVAGGSTDGTAPDPVPADDVEPPF